MSWDADLLYGGLGSAGLGVGLGGPMPALGSRFYTEMLSSRPVSWYRLRDFNGARLEDEMKLQHGSTTVTAAHRQAGPHAEGSLGILYNGTTEFSEATASWDPSGIKPFSIGCWVKPAVVDATFRRIGGREPAGNQGVQMAWHNGLLYYFGRGDSGAGIDTCAGGAPVVGRWSFIVGTYDGATMRFYSEGLFRQQTASGRLANATGTFRLGGTSGAGSNGNATLSEVGLWNYALTGAQIARLYRLGVYWYYFPELPELAKPYIAHLYTNGMQFKQTLGSADGVRSLRGKPGLKMTINGGYHPIDLDVASPQPPPNQVLDPGFEASDTIADVQQNWTLGVPGEWTVMSTAADVNRGRRAIKCTRTTTTASSWNPCGSKTRFPVVAGATYLVAAWSKQNAGTKQSHVKIVWYDAAGSGFAADFPMGGTDGVMPWTYHSRGVVAPVNAVTAELDLMAGWWDGVTGTNTQTWFDDARVVQVLPMPNISNPGFEKVDAADATLPEGWQHNNVGTGTSLLDAGNAHLGARAIALTNPSAGNYGGIFCKQGVPVPQGGGFLTFSFWFKGSAAGTTGPFRLVFANPGAFISEQGVASAQPSAQAGIAANDTTPTVTTAYQLFAPTVVAIPPGYKWVFVEIYANAAGVPATWYMDDITIAPDPLPPGDPAVLGDIIQLTEQGDPTTTILYTGIVEKIAGATLSLTPLVAELGRTDFSQSYTTLTDVGQMVRDAINKTNHLRVQPETCGDSGVKALYNFNTTSVLEVLQQAKRIAGPSFFYFIDSTGMVWFQSAPTAAPPRLTLKRSYDYTVDPLSQPVETIDTLVNLIRALGGWPTNALAPIQSSYSNAASQLKYGKHAMTPLVFPTVTDQATLDKIVATIGNALDRERTTTEIDLPNYGQRLTLGVPGGLVARLFDTAADPYPQPTPGGSGAYLGPYLGQDIEVAGVQQKLMLADVAVASLDELQPILDRIIQGVGVIQLAQASFMSNPNGPA